MILSSKEEHLIEVTKAHVESILSGEGSGHDWWHSYRVWRLATNICLKEKGNLFIVQLASLLHDVEDWKFNDGNEWKAINHISTFLSEQNIEPEIIDHVCDIVRTISFKGIENTEKPRTLEGKIVQDADRLDAIGAIGISRVFSYGGHVNREIYNPKVRPKQFNCTDEYLNNKSTSINHFFEKLLLLHSLMNTDTGRLIAKKRHKFILSYLKEFFKEWEGLTDYPKDFIQLSQLELDFGSDA